MDSLSAFAEPLLLQKDQQPMPALFVGHGSPMNAIELNEFSQTWQQLGKDLPTPTAILCISAHWETRGTYITAMEKPKTIHDFYGFPKALFEVEYPAPGSYKIATETISTIKTTTVEEDLNWGLDHGCWSILQHMYPLAHIPVLQLSMNRLQNPEWHYELAKELKQLRKKGVLIIGSGNMVHNLRVMNWDTPKNGYDWANEANDTIKTLIHQEKHKELTAYHKLGTAVAQAVPTPEHYLPLLYTLGLKNENEQVHFFNDKTVYGSIAMTSLIVGD